MFFIRLEESGQEIVYNIIALTWKYIYLPALIYLELNVTRLKEPVESRGHSSKNVLAWKFFN